MESPLCTATRLADDDVLVATISVGEIREPGVAYDLRNEMLALLKESKCRDLIIDARNLVFIGSVGFLTFLGVRRETAGRIVLCNLADGIRESFAVCRLIPTGDDRVAPFDVASTREEAVSRLSATA